MSTPADTTGNTVKAPTATAAAVSSIAIFAPELFIMAVALAFAGAFGSPLLALGGALAAARIIVTRLVWSYRDGRAVQRHQADLAARAAAPTPGDEPDAVAGQLVIDGRVEHTGGVA